MNSQAVFSPFAKLHSSVRCKQPYTKQSLCRILVIYVLLVILSTSILTVTSYNLDF